MEQDVFRRGLAEFLGAFTLIFVGAGSIMSLSYLEPTAPGTQVAFFGLVAIALAHGLAIGVMVSALGHISGGHFNPAVTLGFIVTRRITAVLAAVYILMQLAGATVAALLLNVIYPAATRTATHLGSPSLGVGISQWHGFIVEAVLTFFLVLVVFATAVDERGAFKSIAGLAIGFTITLDIFMGGPLTGAAMNPARAFGPFLVSHTWQSGWWIYFTAPFVGGALAALLYEMLYLSPLAPEPVGPEETGVLEPRPGDAASS
jgi:MIP family channel proteins